MEAHRQCETVSEWKVRAGQKRNNESTPPSVPDGLEQLKLGCGSSTVDLVTAPENGVELNTAD